MQKSLEIARKRFYIVKVGMGFVGKIGFKYSPTEVFKYSNIRLWTTTLSQGALPSSNNVTNPSIVINQSITKSVYQYQMHQ